MNFYANNIKLEDQAAQADHHFPPAPSSDSGLTGSSDWSQYSSPAQSPAVPHARLARSVRGTERQRAKDEHGAFASSPFPPYYRSPIQTPSAPTLPSLPKSKSRRIPRPPNAFILYRSSLVSKGRIPDSIERRQQTLSRVAGQCWNLLPAAEKRVWQDLAAERAALHQLEYPDYHFKPSPRGKGKAKLRSNEDKSDDAIRALRETYVGICGPSVSASRQRKPKSQPEDVQLNEEAHASASTPSSALPSPILPYDMQEAGAFDWPGFSASSSPSPTLPSPASSSFNDPPLPPCFPQDTFPHYAAPRRPSTSLGFVRRLEEDTSCFQTGYTLERPASAASDTGLTTLVRDLNITPTVANFGHISMPPTPKFYGAPYSAVAQDAIRAPFPFAALNPQFSDLTSGMNAEQVSPNDHGDFSDAHFMLPLDESYGFTNDADASFGFDTWAYDQSMGSGQ